MAEKKVIRTKDEGASAVGGIRFTPVQARLFFLMLTALGVVVVAMVKHLMAPATPVPQGPELAPNESVFRAFKKKAPPEATADLPVQEDWETILGKESTVTEIDPDDPELAETDSSVDIDPTPPELLKLLGVEESPKTDGDVYEVTLD